MSFSHESYVEALADTFRANGNAEYAEKQSKYLKNHFPFFGLKSPDRKNIIKNFTKENEIVPIYALEAVVKSAYRYKEREMHYYAMELMVKVRKKLSASSLKLVKWLITNNSWWDTVDLLATNVIGTLCQKYPQVMAEVDGWISDENMWLRRTAILYQLSYKDKTDASKLFRFCDERAYEKEFFIRKAIGWALREYAKYNPDMVLDFVNQQQVLSGLSKREALKHIRKIT